MDEYLHVSGFFAQLKEIGRAFSGSVPQGGLQHERRKNYEDDSAPPAPALNAQSDEALKKDMG